MNDLNTDQVKCREYILAKPLPGFPVGHRLKILRGDDAIYLEAKGMSMSFDRAFCDMFPGWFTPVYDEPKKKLL